MANRHRMSGVAHSSPDPVAPAPPVLIMPAPAQYTPLRPMPHGLAFRTFPKRHTADLLARFGDAVRTVRLLRAFAQHDLAARAGVHRTHISLIESGAREPRLSTICTIAAALHVNPGDLLPALFPPDPPAAPPSTTPPPFPAPRP